MGQTREDPALEGTLGGTSPPDNTRPISPNGMRVSEILFLDNVLGYIISVSLGKTMFKILTLSEIPTVS